MTGEAKGELKAKAPRSPLKLYQWSILAMLFASTVLNYVDRQTLSILALDVRKDLNLSAEQYGHVVQLFLFGYTLAYLFVGRIADWLGAKKSLALYVIWWSIANTLTGFVGGLGQLAAARFGLGMGEAGGLATAPKAVGDHFAPDQRAFAVGIYTSGAMVGAIIAPPIVAYIALAYNWRMAFVAGGLAGLLWVIVWLRFYPAKASVPAKPASDDSVWTLGRKLTRDPMFLALCGAKLLTDTVWFFYLFWFPTYLREVHGVSLAGIALVGWVVYLAADAGSLLGGIASGALVRRDGAIIRSRMVVMGVSALLMPLSLFITDSTSVTVVLALAGIVCFAHMMWSVNQVVLVLDIYPTQWVSTVTGWTAAASGFGGMISTGYIGKLAGAGTYGPIFLATAFLHLASWVLLSFALRSHLTKENLNERQAA